MNAPYIKFLLCLLLEGTCLMQADSNNSQQNISSNKLRLAHHKQDACGSDDYRDYATIDNLFYFLILHKFFSDYISFINNPDKIYPCF